MRGRGMLCWLSWLSWNGIATGVAVGLLVLGTARDAAAAVVPFTGEVALVIASLDPIGISGAGFATVQGRPNDADHLATLQFDASPFAVTGLLVPVTDPGVFPIAGVIATAHNGRASFAEDDQGAFGGVMPIHGSAKVCLFGTCSNDPIANLLVPISVVGQGGVAYASGAVNLTLIGAPWTTGTANVGTSTAMGFRVGPDSETSSTLNPSGVVRLVTPIFISTNIGSSAVVPAFGFLTLHFVPEPGTALLLGAGIAGLVAGARKRT